jgi:hypothetical protein
MAKDGAKKKSPPVSERKWRKWKSSRASAADLREAIALSCNFDPEVLEAIDSTHSAKEVLGDSLSLLFDDRLDVAIRAENNGLELNWVSEGDRERAKVARLCDFVKWAVDKKNRKGDKLWKELPRQFKELAIEEPERWPWGRYTTKLLDQLAVAVNKYWKDDDPQVKPKRVKPQKPGDKDPRSSEKVIAFLADEKRFDCISPTAAQAIDKIIRHDLWYSVTNKAKKRPTKPGSAKKP